MSKSTPVGAHPWAYAASQPKYDIYPILDQIFADFKRGGFDGVELMHTAFHPDGAAERIAELSKQHGLPVLGTSFGGKLWDRAAHAEVMASAEKVIPRLAQVGGRTLGTSTGPKPGAKKTPEELDAQAELLRKIMKLGADHGVVLNLHNHTYEALDNEYEIRNMIERLPDVKLGPDLNWLLRAGVEPLDFVRRHGRRVVFLHLRDQAAGKWVEALGEGEFDYPALARVLKETSFQGDAVVELAHERGHVFKRPMGENFKLSREHIRKTMGI